jgi:hypothetical protein
MSFVNRFLEDLGASKEKVGVSGGRAKEKLAKRWIAPPEGKTKINVAAAVAKSIPKGAVGVVCRSPDGAFIGASAVVFDGVTHPGSLEAMACREAMVTVADLQLELVYVASDCLEIVKGLNRACMGVFSPYVQSQTLALYILVRMTSDHSTSIL